MSPPQAAGSLAIGLFGYLVLVGAGSDLSYSPATLGRRATRREVFVTIGSRSRGQGGILRTICFFCFFRGGKGGVGADPPSAKAATS